jgi:hypothetical protein
MGEGMPRQITRWARIRDWLLYVAIAALLVIATWIFAAHQAGTGGSARLPLKWLGFAGMTGVVFGYAIKAGLRPQARRKFWVLLGLLFAVHCGVGVVVLLRVDVVPLLLYAVLGPIEYLALGACISSFLGKDK